MSLESPVDWFARKFTYQWARRHGVSEQQLSAFLVIAFAVRELGELRLEHVRDRADATGNRAVSRACERALTGRCDNDEGTDGVQSTPSQGSPAPSRPISRDPRVTDSMVCRAIVAYNAVVDIALDYTALSSGDIDVVGMAAALEAAVSLSPLDRGNDR